MNFNTLGILLFISVTLSACGFTSKVFDSSQPGWTGLGQVSEMQCRDSILEKVNP